jgi:fructose-specific phosphotransferase system component IIB
MTDTEREQEKKSRTTAQAGAVERAKILAEVLKANGIEHGRVGPDNLDGARVLSENGMELLLSVEPQKSYGIGSRLTYSGVYYVCYLAAAEGLYRGSRNVTRRLPADPVKVAAVGVAIAADLKALAESRRRRADAERVMRHQRAEAVKLTAGAPAGVKVEASGATGFRVTLDRLDKSSAAAAIAAIRGVLGGCPAETTLA